MSTENPPAVRPASQAPVNGTSESRQPPTSDTAAKGGAPQPSASANTETSAKVSAAELKKRKKEEKAAKRAQAKEAAGLPPRSQDAQVAAEPVQQQQNGAASSSAAKSQPQKRRPSVSKQLAVRPARETLEKIVLRPAKPKHDKQVALFGHLYGQPRRNTLEGASRDVHPAVLALGLKISSYTICGSTARCVAMLLAFKKVVEAYTTPPGNSLPRHLTSHLSPQIEYLVSCRPLATSMGNAIRWLKLQINDIDPDTEENNAKAELCDAIDTFIRDRITVAGQVIVKASQEKIENGDVVLTFAKSNVVQQAFVEAFKQGRQFRVIVIDSRPLHEGKHLALALADAGIDVTYSATNAISYHVSQATKVFLGAHAMLGNGRLYSRIGTSLVAMCAKSANLPVIVCCESVKFTDRVALDSIVTNEVAPPEELILQDKQATALSQWKASPNIQLLNLMYDVTPPDYISLIITEHGLLPPSSVPVVHRMSTNT